MSGVSAFLWQAALLLLVAYFLGTWIGCLLRRAISRPPKIAMEADATATKPAIPPADRAAADRFGRALDGDQPQAPLGDAAAGLTPATVSSGSSGQTAGAAAAVAAGAAIAAGTVARKTEPSTEIARSAGQTNAIEAQVSTPLPAPSVEPELAPSATSVVTIAPEAPAIAMPVPNPAEPASAQSPTADTDNPTANDAPLDTPAFTPPMTAAAAAATALAARTLVTKQGSESSTSDVQQGSGSRNPAAPFPEVPDDTPTVASKLESLEPPTSQPAELPSSSGSGGQSVVAARIDSTEDDVAAPAVPMNTADDLLQIKGISADDAAILKKAGVTSFSAIAGWTATDVAHFKSAIGNHRRISQENWIEQAQLLSQTGSTSYTRQDRDSASLAPWPVDVSSTTPATNQQSGETSVAEIAGGAAIAAAAVAAASAVRDLAPSPTPEIAPSPQVEPDTIRALTPLAENRPGTTDSKPDVAELAAFSRETNRFREDLQQINGINSEVETLLNEQGVTKVMQIARWSEQDEQRIDQLLGSMNRVKRENWVGQARQLAGVAEDAAAAGGQLSDGAPKDVTDHTHAVGAAAIAAAAAAAANAAGADAPPASGSASEPAASPLADLVPKPPGTPASAPRDMTEPDTTVEANSSNPEPTTVATSPAPQVVAFPAATSARGLRSVKSEALVGSPGIDKVEGGDDLKRIRGVGVLIEKRLQAMGFSTYAQIGSWTRSDVDRVSQKLDFRGRIERENWIEQARILAAGGQTEFSRRRDRDD